MMNDNRHACSLDSVLEFRIYYCNVGILWHVAFSGWHGKIKNVAFSGWHGKIKNREL